jgi:predicted DNA-binding transcriptional regulator YafY
MRRIDNENRIVTIDVIPNKELESLILSYGDDVEVLEPVEFRELIANKIKGSFKKYFSCADESHR